MEGFWRAVPGGLSLTLRVTPKAGSDALDGVERRDDGRQVLRVRVRAVADKGAANAAVIRLIAGAFGVPKSSVTLTGGATARLKTLAIAGDAADLARIARQLEGDQASA